MDITNAESTVDIKGANKIPCLQDIVDEIMENSNNIADILNAFDSNYSNFKFDIKMKVLDDFSSLPNPDAFGSVVQRGGTRNRPNYSLYLNNSKFENSSQIPIAKTFIHEVLHGYLMFIYQREQQLSLFENPVDLEVALENYSNLNNQFTQHQIIADYWVPTITSELEDLNLLKPNLDLSDFQSFGPNGFMTHFAWTGLQETDAYDLLNPQQKEDLGFLLENELNSTVGINASDYGENCN